MKRELKVIEDVLEAISVYDVSRLIPMKRELKAWPHGPIHGEPDRVSRLIPMKRELKGHSLIRYYLPVHLVSRLIPMKRELKVEFSTRKWESRAVSRLIPMKRELKVDCIGLPEREPDVSFKTDPDEKGTERFCRGHAVPQMKSCFKTDPDEKGTERTTYVKVPSADEEVSRLIPMKRELKAHRLHILRSSNVRFKTDPDEKGTERICEPSVSTNQGWFQD